MAKPEYEIPPEWYEELVALRQRVAGFPEDDEDTLIREGEARFAALTPDEQARLTTFGDEILKRIQSPENTAAIDRFFKGLDK